MRLTAGVIFIGLAVCLPFLAVSEVLAPTDEFTFRRVKVSSAISGKRITVQIDPEEQRKRLAPWVPLRRDTPVATDEAGSVSAPQVGAYGWYWDRVSPSIGAMQGRFGAALSMLSQGPAGKGVTAPRLQVLQELARAHGTQILMATVGTDVSPALVLAVIGIESGGRVDAVSPAGARGLMQLIPDTAARFGVTDSTDPEQNIRGGVAYLDWLMQEFDRDPLMVLAAYNAGEGAVRANAGVPPYSETRDYVPKVLAAWQVAQGLCLTPPELVSDPCVFKVLSAAGG